MSETTSSATEELLPEVFAFLHPLYSPVESSDLTVLAALKGYRSFKFDMYCIYCKRESTFAVKSNYVGTISMELVKLGSRNTLEAQCTRLQHSYTSHIIHDGKNLTKIGQYPSIADIQGAELQKFRPLLRDGYFGELTRANGLISHGIGIGAFVYLRRIFEKLITDHYADVAATSGEIEGFIGMRMDEKVRALKQVLPRALVENAAAYGILSKGIHELTEEECKLYFPVVRAAILNILEEDFQARASAEASRQTALEVAELARKLGGAGGKAR